MCSSLRRGVPPEIGELLHTYIAVMNSFIPSAYLYYS